MADELQSYILGIVVFGLIYLPTHSVKSQKAWIFINTAVKTPNLTFWTSKT